MKKNEFYQSPYISIDNSRSLYCSFYRSKVLVFLLTLLAVFLFLFFYFTQGGEYYFNNNALVRVYYFHDEIYLNFIKGELWNPFSPNKLWIPMSFLFVVVGILLSKMTGRSVYFTLQYRIIVFLTRRRVFLFFLNKILNLSAMIRGFMLSAIFTFSVGKMLERELFRLWHSYFFYKDKVSYDDLCLLSDIVYVKFHSIHYQNQPDTDKIHISNLFQAWFRIIYLSSGDDCKCIKNIECLIEREVEFVKISDYDNAWVHVWYDMLYIIQYGKSFNYKSSKDTRFVLNKVATNVSRRLKMLEEVLETLSFKKKSVRRMPYELPSSKVLIEASFMISLALSYFSNSPNIANRYFLLVKKINSRSNICSSLGLSGNVLPIINIESFDHKILSDLLISSERGRLGINEGSLGIFTNKEIEYIKKNRTRKEQWISLSYDHEA